MTRQLAKWLISTGRLSLMEGERKSSTGQLPLAGSEPSAFSSDGHTGVVNVDGRSRCKFLHSVTMNKTGGLEAAL